MRKNLPEAQTTIDIVWACFVYDVASPPPPRCLHSRCLFTGSPSGSFPPLLPLAVVLFFVSVLSYPSLALPLVPCCPRPLAPPIHPMSSCSQRWWWVLARREVLVGSPPLRVLPPCEQLLAAAGCRCWHTGLLSQRVWVRWLGSRVVASEVNL
jgi:hypothetical protein